MKYAPMIKAAWLMQCKASERAILGGVIKQLAARVASNFTEELYHRGVTDLDDLNQHWDECARKERNWIARRLKALDAGRIN